MPIRPSDCFAEPLQDLGAREPALRGIWMPGSESFEDVRGVSELFLDRSATYHERYTDVAHFRGLLAPALERLQLPERPLVLDLGSGSGNTVFACLELLPTAHVVATDISPNLLAILRDTLALDPANADRVTVVKMSAMNAPHRESAYDVAVGGAILHHLIDPAAALRAVHRALAPGGSAIFLEPFENGNAILRLAYLDLLERARWKWDRRTHRAGFGLLDALVHDIGARQGSDKSDPVFDSLDDKWLFTRSMFEDFAADAGFGSLEIAPIHDVSAPFSKQTEVNLRLGADLGRAALPAWCWRRLAFYDESFSAELKRDLLIEGCVVLRKRG